MAKKKKKNVVQNVSIHDHMEDLLIGHIASKIGISKKEVVKRHNKS